MDRYGFIWKAIQKHGYKYNYTKSEYINVKEKVCIICPEHGEFWQTPDHHINRKDGCYKCTHESYDCKSFIEKAKKVHGNKYNYSKVEYKGSQTKVCIICPEHGEFWQTPNNHVGISNECGCNQCALNKLSIIFKKQTEEFIKNAKKIHGDKYDYSKVEYNGNKIKVCIICSIHGEFFQSPSKHVCSKQGCPICNESHLEKETAKLLDEYGVIYERQKRFKWLKNGKGVQSLDFYLPEYNIGVECQGEQHFKPVKYWGGENTFKKIVERDQRKFKLCQDNNIKIIYIVHENKIIEILKGIL